MKEITVAVILIVILFIIHTVSAVMCRKIATEKGFSANGFTWMGAGLGILGLLYTVGIPVKHKINCANPSPEPAFARNLVTGEFDTEEGLDSLSADLKGKLIAFCAQNGVDGKRFICFPAKHENGWRCACGTENAEESCICSGCAAFGDWVMEHINLAYLLELPELGAITERTCAEQCVPVSISPKRESILFLLKAAAYTAFFCLVAAFICVMIKNMIS